MAYHIKKPRFPLGRTVATAGAIALGIDLTRFLFRHHCGDWGDLCDEDKQANEDALIHGDRILSSYRLPDGRKIFIITEWDRSSTCVMLAEEY
jgi:hypothetical protein